MRKKYSSNVCGDIAPFILNLDTSLYFMSRFILKVVFNCNSYYVIITVDTSKQGYEESRCNLLVIK